jgi:carbon monoxide dehydrogenase subunit G
MKLSDEKKIAAPREVVWAGLNDVDVLKASIPGCDSLEKTSDTGFEAVVRAKVGPVKAKFKGAVELSDLNPPESYRISGEGKGGAAGFAKGGATVTLVEDGDDTILKYDVDADVGGKLAQIGGRLLEGTTKKLAGEFFDNFEAAITNPADEETPELTDADGTAEVEAAPLKSEAKPVADATRTVGEGGKTSRSTWLIIGLVFVVGALALTILQ